MKKYVIPKGGLNCLTIYVATSIAVGIGIS